MSEVYFNNNKNEFAASSAGLVDGRNLQRSLEFVFKLERI